MRATITQPPPNDIEYHLVKEVGCVIQRFGEKLRALRRYYRMTVRGLAQALNYPGWSRISAIELGKKKPTAEFVFKVAQVFHVTADELLDDARDLDLPALNERKSADAAPTR